MALRAGKIIRAATGSYELLDALKAPTVYKARVLSGPRVNKTWAVVKTAVGELENISLKREYNNYKNPDIASSPYIRTLYDAVGPFEEDVRQDGAAEEDPPCLVFEWMETDLRSLSSPQYRDGSRLPKTVSKSVLSALDIFGRYNTVHTDINPNHIFLSNINELSPVVKLRDLGMLIKEGYNKQRVQSLPCCFHASDVWSVGVTELANWLYGGAIFGAIDKIIDNYTEAWCIAKLQSLVGLIGPCIDNQLYEDEFELAKQLISMEIDLVGKLTKVGTLRHELQSLSGPSVSTQLLDFIEYLLVIDMAKRPTARDALQHQYLESD
ncbi:kinase-like domain-containing protein [Leptodontidium sp. MPI-SDFR-AT-0119]|nr:kinase-like domain-containing protein [Leptodontidium sp. MPI-SDFR-AT-0119]